MLTRKSFIFVSRYHSVLTIVLLSTNTLFLLISGFIESIFLYKGLRAKKVDLVALSSYRRFDVGL